MFSTEVFESLYNKNEAKHETEKWNTEIGRKQHEIILELIRKGAGEDFIFNAMEHKELSWDFFKDENNLKGISINGENIDFSADDNFEGTDFSYAQICNNEFKNGYFMIHCEYARFYKTKFINCIFHLAYFKNCTIEECEFVNCSFIEKCSFVNCKISNSKFDFIYFSCPIFSSCLFNNETAIGKLKAYKRNSTSPEEKINNKQLSEFYFEIADAYKLSGSIKHSNCSFIASKYETKYNIEAPRKQIRFIFNELMIGYGEKPSRCLLFSGVVIFCFSILYMIAGLNINNKEIILYGIDLSVIFKMDFKMIAYDFSKSLYFSIMSFSSFGFGDILPLGTLSKTLVCIEMLFGMTMAGIWVSVLLKKVLA